MENREAFKKIQEIRDNIDEIDFQIIKLFGERNHCVERIARFKTDKAGVIAKKRQEELISLRRRWAEQFNLNPDLYEKIYRMLIKSNIQKELDILEQKEFTNSK